MITVLSANVFQYVWVAQRFEDKNNSDYYLVREAKYKVEKMYDGDKTKLRTAFVNNVLWVIMGYIISILNVVMIRRKVDGRISPLAIKWLKYAYGPLSLLSLTSFLPPFVSYTSDYTACMIFPILLFTLFGTLISYSTSDSRSHRLIVQFIMNSYIGWYVYKYEFMHEKLSLTNFLTTFLITIFWDGVLTEIYISRLLEYETN